MDLNQVLYGGIAGVFVATAGYLKNRKQEEFVLSKFAVTVIVGLVAGIGSTVSGQDFDAVSGILITGGFTAIVEDVVKAIFKK